MCVGRSSQGPGRWWTDNLLNPPLYATIRQSKAIAKSVGISLRCGVAVVCSLCNVVLIRVVKKEKLCAAESPYPKPSVRSECARMAQKSFL